MNEIPVTAFAATINETSFFQVGNQLANAAWHFSIKLVSHQLADVNNASNLPGDTDVSQFLITEQVAPDGAFHSFFGGFYKDFAPNWLAGILYERPRHAFPAP
ncbi:MAG: hypothetical protein ACLQSR_12500 [Limisphaerales bacterium]